MPLEERPSITSTCKQELMEMYQNVSMVQLDVLMTIIIYHITLDREVHCSTGGPCTP